MVGFNILGSLFNKRYFSFNSSTPFKSKCMIIWNSTIISVILKQCHTRICNSFFSVSKNENSRPILLIFLCWGPMDPETLSPETVYSLKTARDNHVLFSENERGQNFTKSHQSFLDSMER